MGSEQGGSSGPLSEGEKLEASVGQHDMSAGREAGKPVGEHTVEYEIWSTYNVRMDPSVAEYLRSLGGGEISQGVAIAVRFHQAMAKPDR